MTVTNPVPTWGGIDSWKEEVLVGSQLFWQRGIATVLVDMPGTGESPVLAGVDDLADHLQLSRSATVEAAMRYVLAHEAVSVVIPGMKTTEEVDMNIRYSDGGSLPGQLLSLMPRHAWIRNFYQ